ncbi:MAG: diphthamide synthesis protein [archaeon]|nr:2-(3-amino-3-carboxypropyl)histidine synthase subunit [Nanoarchaeota archaeon]
MKSLFIETKYEGKLDLSGDVAKELVSKLPEQLVLAASLQYLEQLDELKSYLEQNGKKVILFQSLHSKYPGQSLGCDIQKFEIKQQDNNLDTNQDKINYDAFLYLGDGMFHPTALAYGNEKPVFIYNPFAHEGQEIKELDKNYWEKAKKRKNALLAKLISSDNIGVLVTRKPGQNQSKIAEELRVKLEEKGKKVFVFIADNINILGLQDFNFIDVWVNTACPRMVEDFPCLNWQDLKEINYF